MRYSHLLASSLAMGVLARPHLDERAIRYRIVTETATQTVTILVTVTMDSNLPTGASSGVLLGATPTLSSSSVLSILDLVAPGDVSTASSTTVTSSSTLVPSSSSLTSVGLPVSSLSVALPFSNSSVASPIAVSSTVASPVAVSSTVASPVAVPSSIAPPLPSASSPFNVGPAHVTGPQEASLSSGTDYMNAILYHHNAARANHNASQLTWCTDCETNARLAAQMCNFQHYLPTGVSEGQNLFTVSGDVFNVTAGITESWYKAELPFMDGSYGEPQISDTVFHEVGHFTQVVWKGTTSVGCVSYDCGDNMMVNGAPSNLNMFTVCNYSPPGNVDNSYDVNVQPPISTSDAALGHWYD